MSAVSAQPTGTVAFLFTDLVGSTRMWEAHESEMAAALRLHDEALRSAIADQGGYVFSTAGDAFAAAFSSAREAAAAAMAMQRALGAVSWPTPSPLTIRIGLHVGVSEERDGNYFGPVLNRAARLMSAANGGQVLMSSVFESLLGEPEWARVDLGEHRLKDLGEPEHIWQLGEGTFAQIASLSAARHNLRVERTPLVGRADEVEAIAALTADHRMVTVLGIGGSGKTRVAAAVAAEVADRHQDGAWFVDLVPAQTIEDVATAIASAVAVNVVGDDLVVALAESMAVKDALVVLDNCEHVTDAVAELVDHVLEHAGGLRILATSREPLDLADEVHFQLEPLAIGDHGRPPALELFAAAAERAGHTLAEQDLDAARSICAHLDGHPLSLELAAAQLKQLTPSQLESHLGQRFELLARRRGGHRHASLVGVLEDTWEMLDEHEQAMLSQLAAFPAHFDLDAALGVCADLRVGLPARTLGGLVDRSLVSRGSDHRYVLLETVKEFVRRFWAEDAAALRHEEWLVGHLRAQDADAPFVDFALADWIEDHWEDWRAIEDRLVTSHRWMDLAEMVGSSLVYFHGAITGPAALALGQRLERFLEAGPPDDEFRAPLHLAMANLGLIARRPHWMGDHASAASRLLATGRHDPRALAAALVLESWMCALRDVDAALAMLDEAFAIAESAGSPAVADTALGYRANHLALAGRTPEAIEALAKLEQRLPADTYTYGRHVHLHVTQAICIIDAPDTAAAAGRMLLVRTQQPHAVLASASTAAAGDVEEAVRLWRYALESASEWFADDGLPDLFITPAAMAYALGDQERCRMLVTAVRHSGRPTQNFMATIMYRQLRDAVGIDNVNPLDERSGEQLLAEADSWMQSLVEAS